MARWAVSLSEEVVVFCLRQRPQDGGQPVLIVRPTQKTLPDDFDFILAGEAGSNAENLNLRKLRWLRHPCLTGAPQSAEAQVPLVASSWDGASIFVGEDFSAGIVGLRPPQLGALHAVLAHWSSSESPATVVLPTGTGKTDTMIAVLVAMACPRLLVFVPSDTLREQRRTISRPRRSSHPSCPILPAGGIGRSSRRSSMFRRQLTRLSRYFGRLTSS